MRLGTLVISDLPELFRRVSASPLQRVCLLIGFAPGRGELVPVPPDSPLALAMQIKESK